MFGRRATEARSRVLGLKAVVLGDRRTEPKDKSSCRLRFSPEESTVRGRNVQQMGWDLCNIWEAGHQKLAALLREVGRMRPGDWSGAQ